MASILATLNITYTKGATWVIFSLNMNERCKPFSREDIPRIPKSIDGFQYEANCSWHSNFQNFSFSVFKKFPKVQLTPELRILSNVWEMEARRGEGKELGGIGRQGGSHNENLARFSLCEGFLWVYVLLGSVRSNL